MLYPMFRSAFAVLILAILAGCATSPGQPRYLHEVPLGTILSLEKELPFEADSVRVYLQGGKVYARRALILSYGGASVYQPLCTLELREKLASTLSLSPREYTIEAVKREATYQSFGTSEFRTQWRLNGGGEPQALYFTCYRLGREATDPPITLEEIDRAVGGYFRLKPAGGTLPEGK